MVNLDLFTPRHVHFIGIDGISMSALAAILQKRGFTISGSDLKKSTLTQRLIDNGATFYYGQAPEHVEGADLVIYTAAIKPDNPELKEAQRRGIPTYSRAVLLGALMNEAKYGVALSGSHGKTTTTAMTGLIVRDAGLDPAIMLGGVHDSLGGNVRVPEGNKEEYFVSEACEYVDTFLALRPYLSVILNIDADHLDYFGDLEHVRAAFRKFAELVPPEGYLVACLDKKADVQSILDGLNCHVVTYSSEDQSADWQARDIVTHADATTEFTAVYHGREMGRISLRIPGRHNVLNALAATAAAAVLGITFDQCAATLNNFTGTHRRFEYLGSTVGARFYDDYAHHPTEIKATLAAARAMRPSRLICVFQPHTYSRTKSLMQEFSNAFGDADIAIITDIYAARETDTLGISSEQLVQEMQPKHKQAVYVGNLDEAIKWLNHELRPGDLVITMGAGDVYRVAEVLVGGAAAK
jgi:UDP-N-acetylmuramate--alanine ligase